MMYWLTTKVNNMVTFHDMPTFDTVSLALFVGFVTQYTIPTLNYIFIVSVLLNTIPTFTG